MSNQSTSRNSPKQPEPAKKERNKYHGWLFRARNTGNYFLFFRPFYGICVFKLDALFLQDLINICAMVGPDDDGWFLCTTDFLERHGWTADEQETRFRSLTGQPKKGQPKDDPAGPKFVKIERRECPARRWVRVDLEAIETALDDADKPTENHAFQSAENDAGWRAENSAGIKEPLTSFVAPEQEAKKQSAKKETRSHAPRVDRAALKPATVVSTELAPPRPTAKDKRQRVRCAIDDIDRQWCDRLRQYVAKNEWDVLVGRTRWEQPFAVLRRRYGQHEVERRLSRYIELEITHFQIRSGRDLLKRWDIVGAIIAKADAARPMAAEAVSAEANAVVADLENLDWRESVRPQLATAVQRSLENVSAVVARLNHAPPRLRFARDCVLDEIGAAAWFVTKHFREVHRRWNSWSKWDGNLIKLTWTPAEKTFDAALRLAISKQTGGESDWDALLAFVNEREK